MRQGDRECEQTRRAVGQRCIIRLGRILRSLAFILPAGPIVGEFGAVKGWAG